MKSLGHAHEGALFPDEVECIDLKLIPADLPFGRTSAIAGEAAYRYIERAVRIVAEGGARSDLHGTASARRHCMPRATSILDTPNYLRRSPTLQKSR